MSIESSLKDFIKSAVVEALAEAGVTGGAAAGGKTETTKAAATGNKGGAKNKPKHTADEVKAILIRVKDEKSMDEAKAIIKKHGKADDLASIKPENFDAAYDAAEKALEEEGGEGDDDGSGGL